MLASIDAELFSGNVVPVTGLEIWPLNPASRRLLLLAARGGWDAAQQAQAARLVPEVVDWEAICSVAIRAMGVGAVYRRLAPLQGVPEAALSRMQHAARAVTMHTLQVEAALLAFKARHLDPMGLPHAFFKGVTLAHRYHVEPSARPCRDVDVLVQPDGAFALLQRLRQAGFTPARPIGTSDRDLQRWMRQETVQGMRSPEGVLIEVHRSLDHGDDVLDVGRLLSRTETLLLRERPVPVFRTADLFVYMCMHHTRHFWSHLHWYADLDAVSAHPLFDLDEVREVASATKLSSTVEACLQLNALVRTGDWPEPRPADQAPVAALLSHSIECLEGGQAREVALRATRLSADRAFAWQTAPAERPRLLVLRMHHRLRKQVRRVHDFLRRRLRQWLGHAEAGGQEG